MAGAVVALRGKVEDALRRLPHHDRDCMVDVAGGEVRRRDQPPDDVQT